MAKPNSKPGSKSKFWSAVSAVLKQLRGTIEDLSTGLNVVIQRPLVNLLNAFRPAAASPDNNSTTQKKRNVLLTLLLLPISLIASVLSIGIKILISPLDVIFGLSNPKSLVYSIPALLVLGGAIFIGYRTQQRVAFISSERFAAKQTYEEKKFAESIEHFQQLEALQVPLTREEYFTWAQALLGNQQSQQAAELIDQLAPGPGQQRGYPAAHQLKAISIAATMPKPMDPRIGTLLKWHLDAGGDSDAPEFQRAWAEYYLGVKDNLSAVQHMEKAANVQPELLVLAAQIYRAIGDEVRYVDTLKKAQTVFRSNLDKNPTHLENRITLGEILYELGDSESAERVLMADPGVPPSKALLEARAKHFLKRFRSEKQSAWSETNDAPVSSQALTRQLNLLQRALEQDLNYLNTYEAMIQFYLSIKETPAAAEVIKTLEKSIENEKAPGLPHFALSNILWEMGDKEKAQFHMEQAFKLSPREMVVVANNLAWILADSENPDLERAYRLSKEVVSQFPNDGRLRDTLATILKKQKKYDEALVEFKLALPTVTDRKKAHQNIAEIYEALGREDLAAQHRNRAR